MTARTFRMLPGRYAIARAPALPRGLPVADGNRFVAVLRGSEGITIVAPEGDIPPACGPCEAGWVALELIGPFPFSETGVLASILQPLADAGVGILAYSSFDTDVVLIKEDRLAPALKALVRAGHRVDSAPLP